jgi:hypothetical protein
LDIFKFFLFYMLLSLYLWSVWFVIFMRNKQNSLNLLTLLLSLLINCGSKVLLSCIFPVSHSVSSKLRVTMLLTCSVLWVLEKSRGVLKLVFFAYGLWRHSWNLIKLTHSKWFLLTKRYMHAVFRVFSFVNHQINFDSLVLILS